MAREHIGQNAPADEFDSFRMGNPQPGDGNQMRQYTQRYEYDLAGNILSMRNVGSWGRLFTYAPTSNRLQTAEPQGAIGTPFTYSYDEHGSMLAMPHLSSMGWNFRDELRHVVVSASQEAWYVYGQGGQRIRKVVRKGNLVEERLYLGQFERFRPTQGNTLLLERETLHVVDDKQRIAMVDIPVVKPANSQETRLIRYQFGNHLGSACLEVDDTASIVSYEEYYPFGSTSYQAVDRTREVPAKRYRYTGKERDEESGLYYHSARYLAPWLARWTTTDPTGLAGGLNLYAYCDNNPVMMKDPRGTDGEVCGVWDENQLVCRTEACPPASLTPEVPTAAPTSSTAPRTRIRIEPKKTPPPKPPPPKQPPPPPPPVSGTDYTLYVPQGFAYTQYKEAQRVIDDPDAPMWARGTMLVLGTLAAPVALAEEYVSRHPERPVRDAKRRDSHWRTRSTGILAV